MLYFVRELHTADNYVTTQWVLKYTITDLMALAYLV